MRTGPVAVICATVLVAGFTFSPTIYRYDRLGGRGGVSVPIRINRLTGRAERYPWDGGDPSASSEATSTAEAETLPDTERTKIEGSAELDRWGFFSGTLYNGSHWTVERIIFRVVAKDVSGRVRWDRKFDERIMLPPLTTETFQVNATSMGENGSCEWSVEAAYGRKT